LKGSAGKLLASTFSKAKSACFSNPMISASRILNFPERFVGRTGPGRRQQHADSLCAYHQVSVRHDVTVRVDDDSGTGRVPTHDDRRILAIAGDGQPEPCDFDLDDGWRHLAGESFQGVAELRQDVRRQARNHLATATRLGCRRVGRLPADTTRRYGGRP